ARRSAPLTRTTASRSDGVGRRGNRGMGKRVAPGRSLRPSGPGRRKADPVDARERLALAEEMRIERGSIVLVGLDPTHGHEQRGTRPCVIVSDSDVSADQRFPLVAVVPISTRAGEGALYPPLSAGTSGLRKSSFALVEDRKSTRLNSSH